ncbi:MAG TPA: amidohydrolase family protein [Kofleriaceae bacterium]|jgi:imidazolonepropionase-like amidohydrolase|nr:amidohydrolase family protein [Kofleriaceae bacterium]
MYRPCWIAASIAIAGCSGKPQASAKIVLADDYIAIVGATVLPMNREAPLLDHTVVVRDGHIAMLAPASKFDVTKAKVIDARGKWVVPGLADMHVHTWTDHDFSMYLLNGVTTVRDMFGSPRHLAWREQIAAGKLDGPTLIVAGPIVDGDPPVWPGSTVVTTVEAAKAAVQDQKRAGYDLIKIYNGLSAEAYAAIAAEAQAQGMPFAGHVPAAVGLDTALASGQRSIEHLEGYLPRDAEPRTGADIVARTAKSKTWNCPTLVVTERFSRLDDPASLAGTAGLAYVPSVIRAQWDPKQDFRLKAWTPERFAKARAANAVRKQLVVDLAKAGAPLVLGTDTGNPYVVPGFAVHDELALLVAAGLTPYQALRTATAAASELAGTPHAFGVISQGARADLLIVDADPRKQLATLATPAYVMVRGKLHERTELLAAAELKEVADPFASLPALVEEGTRIAAARYDIVMNGTVIGRERALIAKLGDGAPVVRGQAVYETPHTVIQYRATRDGLELVDGPTVSRGAGKIVAKLADGKTLEATAAAGSVIAPQSIAEFVWYAEKLAATKVGAATKLSAVAVLTDGTPRLEPTVLTFTRRPDADGRRVFEFTATYGSEPASGTLSLDPDGTPHTIEIKVKWGAFVTKRIE